MSRAQRIAFVCPRFSKKGTIGGAETLLKNLAIHAAQAGREVDFLTTCADNHFTWENEKKAGSERVDGITVHYFPVDDRNIEQFMRIQTAICGNGQVPYEDETCWIKNSVNSSALYEHVTTHYNEYDCIITGPYLFGISWHTATHFAEKTFLVPCLHDESFAYLQIMKEMFSHVRGILFNSEPERELAIRLYGIPETNTHVVGMGLDPFDADPHAFAQKHGLTQPYVLYSGRREIMKGTPLLCDYLFAFRERTGMDVKFVTTGSGHIEAPSGLYPHILDVGFVSEQEKHKAMAGASVFIHPSVNESFGIVLLESWLAGTPAIVHAGGNVLAWQCQSSNGGLWFRNYADFEEELKLLLNDKELRNAMGQSGRNYVLNTYAWSRVEERMLNALDLP